MNSRAPEPNLHDAAVHGWMFEPAADRPGELRLDVDYIVEWLRPDDVSFEWRVAPTTIRFERAWDLELRLDAKGRSLGQEIELLDRQPVSSGYSAWHLVGNTFVADFMATDLTYFIRSEPILTRRQRLTPDERGGISFDIAV